MERLDAELTVLIRRLNAKMPGKFDLSDGALEHLYSVWPFNRFEYAISHLIANGIITLDQYLELRQSYLGAWVRTLFRDTGARRDEWRIPDVVVVLDIRRNIWDSPIARLAFVARDMVLTHAPRAQQVPVLVRNHRAPNLRRDVGPKTLE